MTIDTMIFRFFIFWYVCGVVLLSFDWLPTWLEWSNAVFLILAGLLAVIYFIKVFDWFYGSLISIIIFFFSFTSEYLGSAYGVLFGDYYYTNLFKPNVFDVPLAIGFAWLMVMGTSHVLAKKIVPNGRVSYAIVGAIIAVIIDLIIDPVAYKLKSYWIWEETGLYYGIPFSNFLGWFVVALFLHLVILFTIKNFNPDPLWEKRMVLLFILIIFMFILLGIIGNLWLASTLTAILASFTLLLAKRRRTS